MPDIQDELLSRIKALNERVWEGRATRAEVEDWLNNFDGHSDDERLHALYLLSNFMYFGSKLVKEMLRALYRDLYKYPIVEDIRRSLGDTTDRQLINQRFSEELSKTFFLGVGNPSESGCHLLYYFRQENRLPKSRFIHTHEIFASTKATASLGLRYPEATRYVFLDDFCGSGEQGVLYSRDLESVP